ncbi:hypothetical protein VO54_03760 [Elizabethkingia miricola]|nr:hypothetical protein VO54_03760 [Elizabethkingia miricola]
MNRFLSLNSIVYFGLIVVYVRMKETKETSTLRLVFMDLLMINIIGYYEVLLNIYIVSKQMPLTDEEIIKISKKNVDISVDF